MLGICTRPIQPDEDFLRFVEYAEDVLDLEALLSIIGLIDADSVYPETAA